MLIIRHMLSIKSNQPDSEKLAQQFNLPIARCETEPDSILLGYDENRLALFPPDSGPVFIDFIDGKLAHRRQFGGGKKQPLGRAIGLSSKQTPTVIDATAGMGRDSFVLASLGCQVMMIERSAVVAAMLQNALDRAMEDEFVAEIAARMTVHCADASDYILSTNEHDVIYLDPMYPEKRKSAAVKKDMRALQALVGPDLDSDKLLDVALQKAKHRVVVKRPKHAEPVAENKPNTTISSPNTRYDIYTIKAFK